MIDIKVKFESDAKPVVDAADKAIDRALQRTSYVISQDAKSTIERKTKVPGQRSVGRGGKNKRRRWDASRPGDPPLTRGQPGKNIKGAIRYKVDKEADTSVIGPDASIVGDVGIQLEFGKDRPSVPGDQVMEPRPFMGPAFDRNDELFGNTFEGSIGEDFGGSIGE